MLKACQLSQVIHSYYKMGSSKSKNKDNNGSSERVGPSRVTEQDRAILQMKQMRDKLKQNRKKIQLRLDKDRTLAKTLVKSGQIE